MNLTSELYKRLSDRRNALIIHKNSDPVAYRKYQGELRDLNRKLRLIREQMKENPILNQA